MRYKVVEKNNHFAVYAIGYDKKRLQSDIDDGYFHKYLMESLKKVELIVIKDTRLKQGR